MTGRGLHTSSSQRRGGGWCVEKASCLVLHPGKHRVSLKATVHIHQSNLPHRVQDGNRAGQPLASLYPHISGDLLRVLLLFSSFSVGRKLLRWCNFFFLRLCCPGKKQIISLQVCSTHPGCSLVSPLTSCFLSCSVLVCTNIVSSQPHISLQGEMPAQ